jgi:pimeloyl-ACP methyl ester carboxylesterase/DNA-binding winged helix-turn-helix (wHTH) protein
MAYRFEDCELDLGQRELRRDGAVVKVEPQVFDVLVLLVAHHEQVVTKQHLRDDVWGTQFVSDSALTSRVKAARRAVGDDGVAQRLIRTVHGVGYRFVGDVATTDPAPAATAPPEQAHDRPRPADQQVRFCRADDGVRLAWAEIGEGPPLVKAANWLTHLRHDWESSVWRHWLTALSDGRRFIHYDERGSGMSDWHVEDLSFEAWVHDLEAVVEAAEVDRFDLLGVSQGGPVAIEYAVRNPERVRRLVLYGTFAVGRNARARSAAERKEAEMMLDLVLLAWARGDSTLRDVFPSQFMPNGTPAQWEAFTAHQRLTALPENARALHTTAAMIDVMDRVPLVRVPTLVLHSTGDRRVPFEQGQVLTSLIPGATMLALDSENHLLAADEPAWGVFRRAIDEFLA